ncbi:MAG: biotin/lipoyl-containing protein [Thermoplasmata archaeon]|nr:biotin/lipoyl-containing protein [Thermoplasmata archaeon]
MTLRFDVVFEGEPYRVEVGEDLQVRIEGEEFAPEVQSQDGGYRVSLGRSRYRFRLDGRSLFLNGTPLDVAFRGFLPLSALGPGPALEGSVATSVRAPMPGRVIALLVHEGAQVQRGSPLLILEAMKMQNEIPSPADGEVRELRVAAGDAVGKEDVLLIVE